MRSAAVLALALVAVLVAGSHSQTIPQSTSAAIAWEKIRKLKTTASVMHVTAHPDDEHGGVLAKLSRGDGVRVALLTLNRGESGDNAIGPQLFDALGLIRTEELLQADRYYGVDEQYFTTLVDYGFSKRLDESLDKWGREAALRDVVRIIRMSRPTIILSRFQGNERDGHGNHQAAGQLAVEGFRAAADPTRFPEQIAAGLRPWQAKRVFSGARETDDWTVRIATGDFHAPAGDSFDNIARYGLSFQRSQNGGRFTPTTGPAYAFYRMVVGEPMAPKGEDLFDGLQTSIEAAVGLVGRTIDEAIGRANETPTLFPSSAVSWLANGLRDVRFAKAQTKDPEALFLLGIKEAQFQDAINASLGLSLTAITNPPVLTAPVAGQNVAVDVVMTMRASGQRWDNPVIGIETEPGWSAESLQPAMRQDSEQPSVRGSIAITLADNVPVSTKPYFSRRGLQDSVYTLRDPSQFGRPVSPAPLVAVGRYSVNGVPVEIRETVKRREAKLPYGEVLREVRSVPRLAVMLTPANAVFPVGASKDAPLRIEVELLHNGNEATTGRVTLKMPAGWTSTPASQPFEFARAGERAAYRFSVTPTSIDAKTYTIEAVATEPLKGVPYEYKEGYEVIDHRDLEVRYLYRASTADVRGVDVATVPGLRVGYVMGIGDSVPQGLQQLGAQVTLLDERALASADLSVYDTIMTGTRAYAVREDLKTYNSRLLDYVKAGGNMIVLYNTQELVPAQFAPFPGELPRTAEEVSEEDSPVTILAPTQQSFTWPNRITAADFDGWVEQRGSKFFTRWDAAYTPMISTFDKNQAPQSGGWLTTKVGKGNWTYFAYALHRQLPYGVAGAYRITANLLALGKQPK